MNLKNQDLIINLVTNKKDFSLLLKEFFEEFQEKLETKKTEEIKEEELVTVKQASAFFQVSETTIHAWKNSGVLPFLKIKSRIRFRKSEILALYEKRRNKITNFQR